MNHFFGIAISPNTIGAMSLSLGLSVLLGGLVGLERELHGHTAGLRTHILVSIGATLFTLVSLHFYGGPDSRIAAQIVSGIGFLGAGAIIRDGANVRGLTTAASIWTSAAIGVADGASPFLGMLAVIATVIVLSTLLGLDHFEEWIASRYGKVMTLEIEVRDRARFGHAVLSDIVAAGLTVRSVHFEAGGSRATETVILRVKPPREFIWHDLIAKLNSEEGITGVVVE